MTLAIWVNCVGKVFLLRWYLNRDLNEVECRGYACTWSKDMWVESTVSKKTGMCSGVSCVGGTAQESGWQRKGEQGEGTGE